MDQSNCRRRCDEQWYDQCPTQYYGLIENRSPIVSYITNIPTVNSIFSGGTAIPAGTVIPSDSTTVPVNTVTVITGYTGLPSTNIGGVSLNNGFFTIPISGRYDAAALIGFASVASSLPTDLRSITIYHVNRTTGLVTILATSSQLPIVGSSTFINLATNGNFLAGDRIFVAARQINGAGVAINTVPNIGRFALTLINSNL